MLSLFYVQSFGMIQGYKMIHLLNIMPRNMLYQVKPIQILSIKSFTTAILLGANRLMEDEKYENFISWLAPIFSAEC